MLDRAHEKMIEANVGHDLHYKWSQLNAVAVAKIIKKWNNRCAEQHGQINFESVTEELRATKFYQMTYCFTASSEMIECALCFDVVTDAVLYSSACTHRFCAACAVKTACTQPGFGCPTCRQGTISTLSLVPVKEVSQADEWPKASTLLSSLQKLEPLCNRESEQSLDEKAPDEKKTSFEADQKTFCAPPPIFLKPKQAPPIDVPPLMLPEPHPNADADYLHLMLSP